MPVRENGVEKEKVKRGEEGGEDLERMMATGDDSYRR
jgi:hypothetical protein